VQGAGVENEWGRREEDEGRGRGMWRCFLKWLLGQSRVLLGR